MSGHLLPESTKESGMHLHVDIVARGSLQSVSLFVRSLTSSVTFAETETRQ